ncbi:hypothetical protein L1987_63663 [Smallanthus sonchifolius]|uniref:Uncharacterized protein n=1 Tax=Smallanthus sonchifolius TaxID=185202 RepID=A0ACB9CDU4_9ASTR|nr:hypothetical protein L1987_63663 [Smallanthus sonchifolius]
MVESRRSSSLLKQTLLSPCSSPIRTGKRSKVVEHIEAEPKVRSKKDSGDCEDVNGASDLDKSPVVQVC